MKLNTLEEKKHFLNFLKVNYGISRSSEMHIESGTISIVDIVNKDLYSDGEALQLFKHINFKVLNETIDKDIFESILKRVINYETHIHPYRIKEFIGIVDKENNKFTDIVNIVLSYDYLAENFDHILYNEMVEVDRDSFISVLKLLKANKIIKNSIPKNQDQLLDFHVTFPILSWIMVNNNLTLDDKRTWVKEFLPFNYLKETIWQFAYHLSEFYYELETHLGKKFMDLSALEDAMILLIKENPRIRGKNSAYQRFFENFMLGKGNDYEYRAKSYFRRIDMKVKGDKNSSDILKNSRYFKLLDENLKEKIKENEEIFTDNLKDKKGYENIFTLYDVLVIIGFNDIVKKFDISVQNRFLQMDQVLDDAVLLAISTATAKEQFSPVKFADPLGFVALGSLMGLFRPVSSSWSRQYQEVSNIDHTKKLIKEMDRVIGLEKLLDEENGLSITYRKTSYYYRSIIRSNFSIAINMLNYLAEYKPETFQKLVEEDNSNLDEFRKLINSPGSILDSYSSDLEVIKNTDYVTLEETQIELASLFRNKELREYLNINDFNILFLLMPDAPGNFYQEHYSTFKKDKYSEIFTQRNQKVVNELGDYFLEFISKFDLEEKIGEYIEYNRLVLEEKKQQTYRFAPAYTITKEDDTYLEEITNKGVIEVVEDKYGKDNVIKFTEAIKHSFIPIISLYLFTFHN